MKNNTGMILDGTHQPDNFEDVERMTSEIKKVGGMLNFIIEQSEEGWTAECNEIPGIITGGSNPTPTNFEIEGQIRDAVYTAFHVRTHFPALQHLRTSAMTLSLAQA
jgi:hypothetical protein